MKKKFQFQMNRKDFSDVIFPVFRHQQVPPLLRALPWFRTAVRRSSKVLSAAVKDGPPGVTYSSSLQLVFCLHLSPPVSLSLSLPQPRAKNLQFFASSCYVLAQSVSSPTSFFYLTNEHFKRVTFTDPFSLKTPDWAVCPVPSSVTYSFTVEHCNVIVGLFVTFLHSLLSFLRTGILVLYIFVLTVPRYKSFQKK